MRSIVTTMALTLILGFSILMYPNKIKKKELTLVQSIAQHVVSFNVASLNNKRFATGFHVEYKDRVFILTNKHVCDSNKDIYNHDSIQFEDYVGKIISIDTEHDLCLVTSNRKSGLKLAKLPSEPLDRLILIGHPRGLGKTVRYGHHVDTEYIYAPWIKPMEEYESINASLIAYGGNSGSPVCNMKGEVIGVLFAGSVIHHTEALLVPLHYVKSFLLTGYMDSLLKKL